MPMSRNTMRFELPGRDGGADQREGRLGAGGPGEELSEAIRVPAHSALPISSVIFLASPSNIMVLSR